MTRTTGITVKGLVFVVYDDRLFCFRLTDLLSHPSESDPDFRIIEVYPDGPILPMGETGLAWLKTIGGKKNEG